MSSLVFLCHPYHRGGVTSWMASAAKESAKQGIITYFVTLRPIKPFISAGESITMLNLLNNIDKQKLKLITYNVGYEFELGTEEYRSLIYKDLIVKYIPKGTPIVLSDDSSAWLAACLIANLYPIVGVIHSSIDPVYFTLANKYNHYLSKLVCVSNRTKSNLLNQIQSFKTPVTTIPCGILVEKFKFEQAYQSENELIKIIWLGRLEEVSKRVSDITLIAECLRLENIPFQIRVIGDGNEAKKLSQEIIDKKLEKHVLQIGWLTSDQIIDELSRASFLLQTSNYEGMSVAVMEALAAGCGVVSSRVSGVEDYENSYLAINCLKLYEIGNIEEAVYQIKEISKVSKVERVEAARKFAAQEFSIEACLHKYRSFLEDAMPRDTSLVFSKPLILIILKSLILAIIRKIKYDMYHIIEKLAP